MSAGRITGTMNTLQDSLELDASVSPSGKIEGFLTGSQTGGPLSGTVTDFTAGHASGSLKLVAFDSCSGNWQARRAN